MIERMFTDIAKFMKSQGELHYVCKTMLKIPYTGKSRLVLEAVPMFSILKPALGNNGPLRVEI